MLVADHAVRTSALSSGLIPKPRSISVGETLITPITASPMNRAPLRDATNSGWRNRRRSSIGSRRRSSIAANSASETRPVPRSAIVSGAVQLVRPSIRPAVNDAIALVRAIAPGISSGRRAAAPRFGDGWPRRGPARPRRSPAASSCFASPARSSACAEDRAKGDAAADGGAPDARRECPGPARRERMPDQPETRGDDAGTGGALKEPSRDEHTDVGATLRSRPPIASSAVLHTSTRRRPRSSASAPAVNSAAAMPMLMPLSTHV